MNTVFDYCVNNLVDLINYDQKKFGWKKYKTSPIIEIMDYQNCINTIPKEIGREDILIEFKNGNFYKGYIMAMIWGNIGLQPSRNSKADKTTTSAYKAFSISPVEVENRLLEIKKNIEKNDIVTAYQLLKGKLKFDGIDVSFFTKFLSFISESLIESKDLLIYDKWTKLIHVNLLFDNNINPQIYYSENSINKLFQKNKNGQYKTNLISPKTEKEIDAYLSYNKLMLELSNQINDSKGVSITPFHLEGFLFGQALKGKSNKVESNPRYWVQQNFAKNYLPKFMKL